MDYSHLVTGFFKCKVVAINPDEEELSELLGESQKQPVYCFTKNSIRHSIINIYLQDDKNENLFLHSINLVDNIDVSKTGKTKYVNCVGDSMYAESEDTLWESFKNFEKVLKWENKRPVETETIGSKFPKEALKGEIDLLHYRKLLLNSNIYDCDTNLFYDLDAIFNGDFSQLTKEIYTDAFHFIGFAYVDNDLKQKVWKEFLPTVLYSEIIRGMNFTHNRSIFEKWKLNAFGDFGIKGHYNLGILQVFKEEFIKSDKKCEDDDLSYINNI